MSETKIAIKIEGVDKDFILPHEKTRTIKSSFTSIFRRNRRAHMQHALRDISFEVEEGEFFGIVGRNGSGKSTLLKIIAQIYQPTKGSVSINGKLVPFIELGVGFNPDLTGRENVYLNGAILGFNKKKIDEMYDGIVRFAELEEFMDQKLRNYSSGMQVRLAFSCATMAEADILLVDEVLAVGDAEFQRKCFEFFRYLKKRKKTVIFVSHDMNAIREYCDRAMMIEDSKIVIIDNPNKVATRYSKLFADEAAKKESEPTTEKMRWGNAAMEFVNIKCIPEVIADEKEFEIVCDIKVNQAMTEPIIGFSIKNSADVRVLGTNTKLQQVKIQELKAGQKIQVRWTVPNILNDGDYFINSAIETREAVACDWWEEAARFSVYRESGTGFLVHAPIDLKVER